jgi:hypothetical protein
MRKGPLYSIPLRRAGLPQDIFDQHNIKVPTTLVAARIAATYGLAASFSQGKTRSLSSC